MNAVPLKAKCGTPGYIAPEILRSMAYNEKADIFSLGVIMYNLLSGKLLFTGKDINEVLVRNHRANAIDIKMKITEYSKNA
jgi:calcium/calmodulin-dependent protein kinase I